MKKLKLVLLILLLISYSLLFVNSSCNFTRSEAIFASEVSIENTEVAHGDTFIASIRVINAGDLEGTQTITMDFGHKENVDSKQVVLEGGEETEFDLEYDIPIDFPTGITTVTVWSDNESDSIDVEVVEDIDFTVNINQNQSDNEVVVGENIEVYVDVENLGATDDTQDIKFHVDGTERESKEVNLIGGESVELNFTHNVPEDFTGNEIDVAITSNDDDDYYTVDVLSPAYFEIEIIDIQSELPAGQTLEVVAEVTNTGGGSGKII